MSSADLKVCPHTQVAEGMDCHTLNLEVPGTCRHYYYEDTDGTNYICRNMRFDKTKCRNGAGWNDTEKIPCQLQREQRIARRAKLLTDRLQLKSGLDQLRKSYRKRKKQQAAALKAMKKINLITSILQNSNSPRFTDVATKRKRQNKLIALREAKRNELNEIWEDMDFQRKLESNLLGTIQPYVTKYVKTPNSKFGGEGVEPGKVTARHKHKHKTTAKRRYTRAAKRRYTRAAKRRYTRAAKRRTAAKRSRGGTGGFRSSSRRKKKCKC